MYPFEGSGTSQGDRYLVTNPARRYTLNLQTTSASAPVGPGKSSPLSYR